MIKGWEPLSIEKALILIILLLKWRVRSSGSCGINLTLNEREGLITRGPKTIEGDIVIVLFEHLSPENWCVIEVEPIHISTHLILTIHWDQGVVVNRFFISKMCGLNKSIVEKSIIVEWVAGFIVWGVWRSVYHWIKIGNNLLILLLELLFQPSGIKLTTQCEWAGLIHWLLFNIESFHGIASIRISKWCCENFSLLISSVGGLLPTERPEGWKIGLSNEIVILHDDFFGRTMDEEVDLKLTAKGNETENCLIVRSLILKS